MSEALAATLKGRRVRAIGVQAEHFTLAHQSAFAKALGGRSIKAIPHVPAGLRAVKDAGEIRAIRRSIRVAERAFKEMFSQGKRGFVGRCEREVAAELDYRMRLAGASAPAFETIVAAGPHASRPHYRPGGRRIAPDEAVLIDWGAMTDCYCSDLTRVVFTGRIPPKIAEIYEVVLRAQVAGIAAVRAGRACGAVDAAARDVIGRAGWGDNFTHGLGHGIGREIHELPGLVSRMKTRLRAGMVVTVEPGIYLPGVGGVRIEDDVLVSVDGPVRLGSLPTAARAMVLR
jgi:Xaa-Pro aminopeptidase